MANVIFNPWSDMLTPKLQQLADYKAKVEKLEKSVQAERDAVLRGLHTETGYATRDDLISALQSLGGGGKRGRKPGKAAAGSGGGKRKKRVVITPDLREGIIAAVKAGGTGSAVAKKFGVSLPTVQNIKRDAGLTKKRKGK